MSESRKQVDESAKKEQKKFYSARFAEKLRAARERLGKSQEAVAADLKVNTQTIINYENKRSLPDAFHLAKLAESLRVNLDTLLDPAIESPAAVRDPLQAALHLITSASELGVVGFHRTRGGGLREFTQHLRTEIKEVFIVASSIRGLTEGLPDFADILQDLHRKDVDIKVVLSSPLFSFLREPIESRRSGAIWDEIMEAAQMLTKTDGKIGLDDRNVRFFPGTPTVFLLATSRRMLLNPYTYGTMAYQTFCVEVQRPPESTESVYDVYLREHFTKAYQNSIPCNELREHLDSKKEWCDWVDQGREYLEEMMKTAKDSSS